MLTHRQLFLQHVAQTSPEPLLLEIDHATGAYLYEKSGRALIDLIGGIAVANVGHSHPRVVQAINYQAQKYTHVMVYGELVQSPQVLLAKALTDLLPPRLNSVYFTNSGAEAAEAVMKLAKRATGRTQFVHFKNSYHGSTQGALSLIGSESFKRNFRPLLPDVLMLPYGQEDALQKITCRTAAVFMDPVQAESGVTIPSLQYMLRLREICTLTGALLVFDESQTAFGRCGSMFCFEQYDVVPDVLMLSKALGGGMPLGAMVASSALTNLFTENPVLGHITTFGGHPVCCAAGLAALQVLQDEKLIIEVEAKGKLFEKHLKHPRILSLRRKGLMLALEFSSFEENKKIIDRCIALGAFTDWFLFAPACLRICPPLVISEPEITTACGIILQAIDDCNT